MSDQIPKEKTIIYNLLVELLIESGLGATMQSPLPSGSIDDNRTLTRAAIEKIVSLLLVDELISDRAVQNQRNYDFIYQILFRMFGWTRLQLHQCVLELRSVKRTQSDIIHPIILLTDITQRVLLLRILKETGLDGPETEEGRELFRALCRKFTGSTGD